MSDLITSPTEPQDDAPAREAMAEELAANIDLLEHAAKSLEAEEVLVRECFVALRSALSSRNVLAVAYSAGVRNLNRMLAAVAHARESAGDAEWHEPLEYVLPEAVEYQDIVWPDEWPQSDLINAEGFNLTEIVGA